MPPVLQRRHPWEKDMYRRKMTGLLAVGLACSLLAGCGGKKTALDPDRPVKVTVWDYYTGAQMESFHELVTEFNRTRGKELGIVVDDSSEGGISDLETNVMAAINKEAGARDVPNMFAVYSDTAYKVYQMGELVDLSEYLTEEERAEYVDSYIEEGAFDKEGEMMLFPVAKATEIFFLNKTDWDKFSRATGADMEKLKTIEGVAEIAEAYYEWTDSLTDEPEDGKAFFGRDSLGNYMLSGAWQLGGDILTRDPSGKVTVHFDEEIIRKLWDYYYVPYVKGYFASAGRFRSDDVKTGSIVSFVGSSAGATFFPKEVILENDESYPIETVVMEAPQFADNEKCAIQQGAGIAVTKGSEAEIEASVEFLKWFTDTQQNLRFAVASGYLPVKKEANDMEEIRKTGSLSSQVDSVMQVAVDTMNSYRLISVLPFARSAEVRNLLEDSMQEKAETDRAAVEAEIAAGKSREEAAAQYDTDENFRSWYEEMTAALAVYAQ